jgi:hypothetical protein
MRGQVLLDAGDELLGVGHGRQVTAVLPSDDPDENYGSKTKVQP